MHADHGLDYAFTVSMIKDNVIDEIMKGKVSNDCTLVFGSHW